jgi:hypothetical protein
MKKIDFEAHDIHELRRMAWDQFNENELPTGWCSVARRDEVITAIESGRIPERFTADHLTPEARAVKESGGNIGDIVEDKDLRKHVQKILNDMSGIVKTNKGEADAKLDFLGKKLISTIQMLNKTGEIVVAAKEAADKALAQVEKRIMESSPVKLVTPEGVEVDAGRQHKAFPMLCRLLALKQHVFICGPAGTGKTRACFEYAKAVKTPIHVQSFCMQSTKADVVGYRSPHDGSIVRTPFREAYENGGVYVADEGDSANSNVFLVLNSGLEQDGYTFPDGWVKRHDTFRCVLIGNTWGGGADRQYVGRAQLDAATISRFSKLWWGYDEPFESYISGNHHWAKRVHEIRAAVEKNGDRVLVTARAAILGAQWLAAGGTYEEAEVLYIYEGLPVTVVNKIKENIRKVADVQKEADKIKAEGPKAKTGGKIHTMEAVAA